MITPPLSKFLTMCALSTHILAAGALAEPITLQSIDGSTTISGELISFDDGVYVVANNVDQFRINADSATCIGDICDRLFPAIANLGTIHIAGSDTIGAQLMPSLIGLFARSKNQNLSFDPTNVSAGHGDIRYYALEGAPGTPTLNFDLVSLGSSTGFRGLLDGTADIAMSSRPIKDQEQRDLISSGLGDPTSPANQIVLGLDGLAVVVAPSNPISALTATQIANIFSGRITNWSQVGGLNAPITVLRRDDNSGTTGVFNSGIMEPVNASFIRTAIQYDSNSDLVDNILSNPNAIGFTGFSHAEAVKPLGLIDECGFQSDPGDFQIKTGEYPLARKLYLFRTNGESANGEVPNVISDFMAFAQTDIAQTAVSSAGYVDQSITALPLTIQGNRMVNTMLADRGDLPFSAVQRAIEELSQGIRVSSTFRFNFGSATLDVQAQGDIPRLVDYLLRTDLAGKEVAFIGFSDSIGNANRNRDLSLARAAQVLNTVTDAMGSQASTINFTSLGLGESSPLGCNLTEAGREVNRRVEVWIR